MDFLDLIKLKPGVRGETNVSSGDSRGKEENRDMSITCRDRRLFPAMGEGMNRERVCVWQFDIFDGKQVPLNNKGTHC